MKKSSWLLRIGLIGLTTMMTGELYLGVSAGASSTYQRTRTVKTARKAYYTTSKTGRAYQFKGGRQGFKMTKAQPLNYYLKTTWIRTAKTTVSRQQTKTRYYRVTNQMNGYSAWVNVKYLKPGRDYQKSKSVKVTPQNYVQAKPGHLYEIYGDQHHMTFDYSGNLHPTVTYRVLKKCYIYKRGKRYQYFYVRDRLYSEGRWVWSGYLKPGTYVKPDSVYNKQAVVDGFIRLMNQYRAKEGAGALTYDANLQKVGDERGPQLKTLFSHRDANGNFIANMFIDQIPGLGDYYGTEDIETGGFTDTNKLLYTELVAGYKSSPGHWNDLMGPDLTKIGVGLYNDNGDIYNAVELGF